MRVRCRHVVLSTQHEKVGDRAVPEPYLQLPERSAPPRAAILVLHGGKANSSCPVEAGQLAVRRMHPFARDLAALGDDLAVAQLRYRIRGWNGTGADALADVDYALDALDAAYGGVPTVHRRALDGWTGRAAIGRSCRPCAAWSRWRRGSRAPNRSSSSPVATSSCCTAPATAPPARRRRRASSTRAVPIARRAVCLHVPWSGHGMLARASTWQRLTAAFTAAIVDDAPFERPLELARAAGCPRRHRRASHG